MAVDYDLVVIGDTVAGRWAAITAARLKARVALVVPPSEARPPVTPHLVLRELGTKAQQAAFMRRFQSGPLISTPDRPIDFERASHWVETTLETLKDQDSPALLASFGIDRVVGTGAFHTKPGVQLQVAERCLRSRSYLIAAHPEPEPPKIPGLEPGTYLKADDTLLTQLKQRKGQWPDSIVILGAGPQAIELCQTLACVGTEATLIAQQEHILPHEDPEVAFLVQAHLEATGIRVLTNTDVKAVKVQAGRTTRVITGDDDSLNTQEIVWAGEQPTKDIPVDVKALGLQYTPQGLWVNAKLQTSHPRIYACGSILGGYSLPHIARYEASIALKNALFGPHLRVDYRHIPWAIFTQPELARVGLTEPQARRRHQTVHVLRRYYKTVAKANMQDETTGFCKLLVDSKGYILGGYLVGTRAADLVHLIAFASQHRCPISTLADLAYISPTLSEITFQIAAEWKTSHQGRLHRDILASFFKLRRG